MSASVVQSKRVNTVETATKEDVEFLLNRMMIIQKEKVIVPVLGPETEAAKIVKPIKSNK